jgi:hypothetical protein
MIGTPIAKRNNNGFRRNSVVEESVSLMDPIKYDFLVPTIPCMIILSGILLSFLAECFKAMEIDFNWVGDNVSEEGVSK